MLYLVVMIDFHLIGQRINRTSRESDHDHLVLIKFRVEIEVLCAGVLHVANGRGLEREGFSFKKGVIPSDSGACSWCVT
jgi:hypothetical protein